VIVGWLYFLCVCGCVCVYIIFGAEQAQVSGYKCRNGAFLFFRHRRGTGGELLRLHNMQGISCD
jgi:hypothetical protein